MRISLLLFILCFVSSSLFSQDVIIKKNGDEIQAIVKEITVSEIKYKRFDNPEGPLISIANNDVFMIKYQNGTTEVIKGAKASPETKVTEHPAQPKVEYPTQSHDYPNVIEPVKLSGPRVGATHIAPGRTAKRLKEKFNAEPFLTLFGWQFETQFFSLPSGTTGILEFVPLIAGLEQGLFLPSGSLLVGMRGPAGMEFGVGPNLSIAGAAMVFAAGVNLRSSEINFPVNFAVVASPNGARYSITVGFNVRRY